jgi:hypothetical protein
MKMIKKKYLWMPKVSKVPIKAVIKISGNSSQTGYQKRKKIKKQDFFPKVKKIKISFNCKCCFAFCFPQHANRLSVFSIPTKSKRNK